MRHGSRARLSIALALLIASVGCAPGADRFPSSAATTPAPTSAAAVPTQAKPAAAPANPDAAAPKPASSAAAGRPSGEISYWAFGDAEELAIFEAVVEGYRRHNADVTVKLNIVPNQNEFMTKLSASFTAGAGPDVFLINYRRYGQYAEKNVLEPLEGRLAASSSLRKDQFFEIPLKAFTWNGTLQCIPQNQSSLVVYYNRDVFEKYGVALPRESWRWRDFLDTARALTKDTDGDGGIDLHGLAAEPTIIRAAPFIWQRGGRLVDDEEKPTRITMDDPKTKEALRFFVDLGATHRVSPNEAEYKAEGPDSRFMRGKAAMTLNSRRAVPELRTIKGFTWDVAAPPSDAESATTLHSDAYCLSAASGNKAAAWEFIEYAIGLEGQQITARLGRTVPSLKDVATSPAFLDPGQAPANSKLFLELAPKLKLLPILAEWPAIERFMNEEIEAAFFGTRSFDEAIETANRKSNEQLKR
ncbi:MAG TPA: sugar ABC transporter substrate-binding protein [Chloroflexota bacterium]|nr:sugar ABC transporter substrate-binding protein [Chloroflexota bacterium]